MRREKLQQLQDTDKKRHSIDENTVVTEIDPAVHDARQRRHPRPEHHRRGETLGEARPGDGPDRKRCDDTKKRRPQEHHDSPDTGEDGDGDLVDGTVADGDRPLAAGVDPHKDTPARAGRLDHQRDGDAEDPEVADGDTADGDRGAAERDGDGDGDGDGDRDGDPRAGDAVGGGGVASITKRDTGRAVAATPGGPTPRHGRTDCVNNNDNNN